MDNKLSELSKPVAYDYQIAGACIADGHNENGKWVDWNNKLSRYCPPDWMVEEGKVTELKPLYSQEYVSALLAELEATRKQSHELAKQCGRLGARAAIAERKLATPVRLVDYRNSPDMHTKQYYEAIGFNQGIDACSVAVRTAGFTVEGDE